MLTPTAPFAFPLCEDTFICEDTVTYDGSTTYKDTPPLPDPAALCISQEDVFTAQCDVLIQSLASFWPSQLASHFHLLDLDEALIAATPPDSDPRLSFTESAYTVKLSKLPERVRVCVKEFSEAIKRIGYVGVDEGIELTPWQRYMLWKASCCGDGSDEGVEVRCSDCVRGWRYDYAQACALLHEIKGIAQTYKDPSFPSHSTYFIGDQEFCQVNDQARWDVLRVLKTAFLTFCEMDRVSVLGRGASVYQYRGDLGMRRFRMDWDGEFDLFLHNALEYVFWLCPSPDADYLPDVTYGDLERDIMRLRERRPDFDVPVEWEEQFVGDAFGTAGESGREFQYFK